MNGVDLGSSRAGALIRSNVLLTAETSGDYTDESGNRYLRRGLVETDQTKFDTGIWPDSYMIKVGEMLDVNTPFVEAASTNEHGEILACGGLRSRDGGDTFESFSMYDNYSGAPVFSNGKWIAGVENNSNGYVHVSEDLFENYTAVTTGLADGVQFLVATPSAAIVSHTQRSPRRSIDGGLTWNAPIQGYPVTSTERVISIASDRASIFVAVTLDNDNVWLSSNDGANFIHVADAWKSLRALTSSFSQVVVMHDGEKFCIYTRTGRQTSVDGQVWGEVEFNVGLTDTLIFKQIYFTNGFYVAQVHDGNLESIYLSSDGLNWLPYTNNSKVVDTTVIPTDKGIAICIDGVRKDNLHALPYAGDYLATNEESEFYQREFVRIS